MNDADLMEKLQQMSLSPRQQHQLFSMIETIFKNAIDARSPRNRPPGKAGLKAEKGYYRLLYLEDAFRETVNTHENKGPHEPTGNGAAMAIILRQLTDIPELRSELLAGIEAALIEVTNPAPKE